MLPIFKKGNDFCKYYFPSILNKRFNNMATKIANKKSTKIKAFTDGSLLKSALKAVALSYSPYSQFAVGAAVLKANGKIYLGANIENASYPLCLCAERSAIAHAHSSAPKSRIIAIAVVAKSRTMKITKAVSPCGACRQVISEFEEKQNSPIRVILGNEDASDRLAFSSIKELLPHSFDSKYLIS
jgi:cytidine deaminase